MATILIVDDDKNIHAHLAIYVRSRGHTAETAASAAEALAVLARRDCEVERHHIQQVLADSATLEDAAARLGINPTTLWRKRKRYGLE